MPLTKSFRDEENERYKTTLQRLMALTLVPKNQQAIDGQLAAFGLCLHDLQAISSDDLLAHLHALQLDFENAERFADFLAQSGFRHLAKTVYGFIQQSSQSFSFAIFNKINAL